MNNQAFKWILIVAVLFLIGAFAYNKNQSKIQDQNNREVAIQEEVQRPSETLIVKYQHKNGKNIFVGSLVLPTPCHTHSAQILKKDENYEIAITTVASLEMCAQVVTVREFRVEIEGSADDVFIATLNGEVVNLNLFVIPEDKNIDEVDITPKG